MVHEVATGELVTQAGVEVAAVDDILAAVRTLASSIRTTVGDNRRQVDSDSRLERVTTASLEALRDYTAGVALLDDSHWAAAEFRLSAAVRRDASFASAAMMLAHSRRNQQRPASDYMPMAQQAFALAAGLPTRERYFIEGSYYGMVGDTARAIAAYQVLTREHPEDFWGLNNLAAQLLQSGRYREEIPILKRLAVLRPNSGNWLTNYAMRLIADGDGLTDARRLIERASTLELPPGDVGTALDSLFETFPAYVAWVEGRVEDAAEVMDRPTPALAVTDHHLRNRGHLNLTLGRVRAAERTLQSISVPAERVNLLAQVALARGDTVGARAVLNSLAPEVIDEYAAAGIGRAATFCWTMLRAGLVEDCRRLSRLAPLQDDPSRWIVGQLAAVDGDAATALPILEGVEKQVPPGRWQTFIALDTVAGILERRGDLMAAAEVLGRSDGAQSTPYPNGLSWLQMRVHLLSIERQLGHTERVEALERELRRLLAAADSDFVLRQYLQ
jgi:tetratricopeptide (TPR) repeat protein